MPARTQRDRRLACPFFCATHNSNAHLSEDSVQYTIAQQTTQICKEKATMHSLRLTFILLLILYVVLPCSFAQTARVDLTQPQDYVLKRVSSFDRSGGNADYRQI